MSNITENLQKHTILIAVIASITLFLVYSLLAYLFRDRTEEIRIERLNTSKAQMEKAQKEIDDAMIRKESATSCYKANSQTGVLATCEFSFIPKVDAAEEVSKTGATKVEPIIEKPIKKEEPKTLEPTQMGLVWLKNAQGISKSKAELNGSSFDEISLAHGIPTDYWHNSERKWKVKKEVALCIAWADSGLGRHLKTRNNIGNVGNNDRGDRVHISTMEKGVDVIFQTLNNKFLGSKQTIGSLSVGGGGKAPFYATSPDNWDKNTRNCLGVIHGVQISKDFKIRL